MEAQLSIPVIVGTTRPGRQTIHAAKLVHQIGQENEEVNSQLLDPKEFDMPLDGKNEELKDPRYTKITKDADGFFIVTPEYNHGYPGTLKRFLDSELKNYIHKPVAFAGVSSGNWGGVRAIEALVPVVREMGLVATFTDVKFPNVKNIFDESGQLLDDNYPNRIKRAYTELIWMARVLSWGRKNLDSQYHE